MPSSGILSGFGAHASLWVANWERDAEIAVKSAVQCGMDYIEIPMFDPTATDTKRDHELLDRHNLRSICSLGLPEGCWPSVNSDKAVDFLKLALDKTAEIGAVALTGVTFGGVGQRTGFPPTAMEIESIARVLEEVAKHAAQKGLRLGIEPVNRYDNHLVNTGRQAVELIEKIGAQGLFVHLDTYHMHIEERGIGVGIIDAREHLGYIHISESDRGIPGHGNCDWNQVYAALAAVGYRGGQTIESFVNLSPELAALLCIWRPVAKNAEELIRDGLPFIKNLSRQYGLTAEA